MEDWEKNKRESKSWGLNMCTYESVEQFRNIHRRRTAMRWRQNGWAYYTRDEWRQPLDYRSKSAAGVFLPRLFRAQGPEPVEVTAAFFYFLMIVDNRLYIANQERRAQSSWIITNGPHPSGSSRVRQGRPVEQPLLGLFSCHSRVPMNERMNEATDFIRGR